MASTKGLKFLEFSYPTIDEGIDQRIAYFFGLPLFWPLKQDAVQNWPPVTVFNVETFSILKNAAKAG